MRDVQSAVVNCLQNSEPRDGTTLDHGRKNALWCCCCCVSPQRLGKRLITVLRMAVSVSFKWYDSGVLSHTPHVTRVTSEVAVWALLPESWPHRSWKMMTMMIHWMLSWWSLRPALPPCSRFQFWVQVLLVTVTLTLSLSVKSYCKGRKGLCFGLPVRLQFTPPIRPINPAFLRQGRSQKWKESHVRPQQLMILRTWSQRFISLSFSRTRRSREATAQTSLILLLPLVSLAYLQCGTHYLPKQSDLRSSTMVYLLLQRQIQWNHELPRQSSRQCGM